jgi:RNA polymerase sigma-70 factor (ECF subfamily)
MNMERMVRQYYQAVYSYCMTILLNREMAEDATQDVFIKIQDRYFTGLQVPDKKAWFLTVARNHCYDVLRHENRIQSDGEMDESIPSQQFSPEALVLRNEERDLVREGLSQLTIEDRELIVLRDFNGLSYREVAGQLGISAKTVKWKLFNARRRLACLIGEEHG